VSEPALPSGIVTFVFSDIEGSTRLMKRLGPAYPDVLERHRTLLRSAWRQFHGSEIGTEGDGFFVAFADATEAIAACREGQRLVQRETWPFDGTVKVRMGVHSGLAVPHHGDYVALAVSQASRVTNAAHGGQVLVSSETVGRSAPVAGIEFINVGRFRLRDFDDPVKLLQLSAPGLQAGFPAVRALPAEGHNLVRAGNAFIGREDEVARLTALLGVHRLVTIAGPAGVGKTRLATELGIRIKELWSDGVWAVDLASVEDASLVPDAVGAAIGAPLRGGARWDEVVDYLRERAALIVLDNIDVHVEACARLVPQLLRSCPRIGVLTTGREPLRIADEEVVRLRPLPVPPAADNGTDPRSWAAVQLFLERASAARSDFELTPENIVPVIGICRRLEGLPLAIEIAAARTAVLDPGTIAAGLDDMNRLLRSNDRSLPARQRTMQSLLDWSYRLLNESEQAALRRLAVFGGGFSIESATAAVGDSDVDPDQAPELIWSLVDHSMLTADLTANATRYRFLEPVRQYGRRHLDEAHETSPVAIRLAAWYLQQLGPWRSADRTWIGDVGLELDNLRALIPLLPRDRQEPAQQLACVVGRYLEATQSFRTGIAELSRAAVELGAQTASRVALLTTLADLHLHLGDIAAASSALSEASDLQRVVGSADWDAAGVARTTGEIATQSGDAAGAAAIAETALRSGLSPRGRARMLNLLGIARYSAGDFGGAAAAFSAERLEHLEAGHEAFVAGAEGNLAEIALRLGDVEAAALHQRACLEIALALGQPVMVAYSFIMAARIAGAMGAWPTAVRLQAKATLMLSDIGQRLYENDSRASEELLVDARAALGVVEFNSALDLGRRTTTPDGAALALEVFLGAAKFGPSGVKALTVP
jgi:predicted ATPase/class 3 adenylate cyclase